MPRFSLNPKRSCRRLRGPGAHQLRSPSSTIREGTSSARIIVASMITASAVPTPTSLMNYGRSTALYGLLTAEAKIDWANQMIETLTNARSSSQQHDPIV
jgi:hypothetical protein